MPLSPIGPRVAQPLSSNDAPPVPNPVGGPSPANGAAVLQAADSVDWKDPDSYFVSAINAQRGLGLIRGIQGNVWAQAAHMGAATMLDMQWKGLQLNPLTARFYDGKVG